MPDIHDDNEPDGQDLAEVFDEEQITPDGRDIATSDLQRDVYDATSSDEDADETLASDDDFDPDSLDEDEFERLVLAEEDLDEVRSFAREDRELVAEDDLQPDDFEAGEFDAADGDPEEAMAERIDRDGADSARRGPS